MHGRITLLDYFVLWVAWNNRYWFCVPGVINKFDEQKHDLLVNWHKFSIHINLHFMGFSFLTVFLLSIWNFTSLAYATITLETALIRFRRVVFIASRWIVCNAFLLFAFFYLHPFSDSYVHVFPETLFLTKFTKILVKKYCLAMRELLLQYLCSLLYMIIIISTLALPYRCHLDDAGSFDFVWHLVIVVG